MADVAEHLGEIIGKYEGIRVLSDEAGVRYLDGLLRAVQRRIPSQSHFYPIVSTKRISAG